MSTVTARWFGRAITGVVAVTVGLGAVALFLLSTATGDTERFTREYPLLLGVTGALALCLLVLVGYQLAVLLRRLRRRVFGSRLALRFLLLFALMAVLPGAIVYSVSVQFLARSIESWFDVKVDTALEGGINLGRTALDNLLRDVTKKTELMASALARRPASEHASALGALREQSGVEEATLFSERGHVIASAATERIGLLPQMLKPSALQQARRQQSTGAIETAAGGGLILRAIAPVNVLSLDENVRVLQVVQPVPLQLAQDAELVQAGYRDYQELSLARVGLKRLYGLTLTLALVLALLFALALAFLLSARLATPLGLLAQATDAVARGDFTQRVDIGSADELGALGASFNAMTRQLADARAAADANRAQLEAAKAHLESVLSSLSAGVMSFDSALRLRSFNPGAALILGLPLDAFVDAAVGDWRTREPSLEPVASVIEQGFAQPGKSEWERQIEYRNGASSLVLLLRGARFAGGADTGFVVVFDDVTRILEAQRDAAWSEVARRLAHEIKNPLTPIQLSAERLQMKLADKLQRPEADMLERSTRTIVNQVAALKSMVDAFSQYAKAPGPKLGPLDVNQLVREVLQLYESLSGRLLLDLADALPPVIGDATQLRQVIHNLVQNAQDAVAEAESPRITVSTSTADGAVRLVVEDNGTGFPPQLMQRVFEPYVTTKPRGTGLGLVIVKKIVEEHGGSAIIENRAPKGARVVITLPAPAAGEATARLAGAARR